MEADADSYSSSLVYEIADHKSSGEAMKMAINISSQRLEPNACIK
jgi:hypothetical protein